MPSLRPPLQHFVLEHSNYCTWTLQGLNWYTNGLKEDRDGDVASEFLEEPSTPSAATQQNSAPAQAPASLKVREMAVYFRKVNAIAIKITVVISRALQG